MADVPHRRADVRVTHHGPHVAGLELARRSWRESRRRCSRRLTSAPMRSGTTGPSANPPAL